MSESLEEPVEKKCIKCPNIHSETTATCPRCLEEGRAYHKRKREERAEVPEGTEKKCAYCPNMHKESTARCPKCKEKKRAYDKRKREALANVPEGTEKKCSNCPNMHKESTARCPKCKEKKRAYDKRKREAQQDVPDGHKHCTSCGNIKHIDQFISSHPRRTEPTTTCKKCRDSSSRTQKNPKTKSGACREVWINWKKNNPCRCGETRSIHARGKYRAPVHMCSEYSWWAWNGGTEALQKQLKDCYPLCKFCYRLIKPAPKYTGLKKSRYDIINAEKLCRGCCKNCKRKVTSENLRAFDFDHINPDKKVDAIAMMVNYSQEKFDILYPKEVPKCDLLCCMCHDIKTYR